MNTELITKGIRSIERDLANLMQELASKDIEDNLNLVNEDFRIMRDALHEALLQTKIRSKEKYTPKKYRKNIK